MAILITAASYSTAFKIHRLLNSPSAYFGEQLEMPQISGKKFIRLPEISSLSFVNEMLKLCLDHQIKTVFPLKRAEIITLSTARQLFEEYEISMIIPSDNWIQTELIKRPVSEKELLILSNGKIIAGALPDGFRLPENEKSGIFSWELINDEIKYQLFKLDHVEI